MGEVETYQTRCDDHRTVFVNSHRTGRVCGRSTVRLTKHGVMIIAPCLGSLNVLEGSVGEVQ